MDEDIGSGLDERQLDDLKDRVRRSPFLVDTTQVRAFIFDVHTGALREVF